MKKMFLIGLGTCIMAGANAQVKKAPAKPAAKTVAKTTTTKPAGAAQPVVLKTALDSLSYAIGVLEASFLKQQNIDKLNYKTLAAAVEATLENKNPLFQPQDADMILRQNMQKMAESKNKAVIDEGAAFLANNKKRPGVKETASGLQYEVIKEGTGEKPTAASTVKVHYTGTLLNGTKFDSSRDRNQPVEFPLQNVIRGWTEGVQLMNIGSTYKFYIPYQLAYGLQGSPPTIPGGATLVFEVELLDIIKGDAGQQHNEHDGHNH